MVEFESFETLLGVNLSALLAVLALHLIQLSDVHEFFWLGFCRAWELSSRLVTLDRGLQEFFVCCV